MAPIPEQPPLYPTEPQPVGCYPAVDALMAWHAVGGGANYGRGRDYTFGPPLLGNMDDSKVPAPWQYAGCEVFYKGKPVAVLYCYSIWTALSDWEEKVPAPWRTTAAGGTAYRADGAHCFTLVDTTGEPSPYKAIVTGLWLDEVMCHAPMPNT